MAELPKLKEWKGVVEEQLKSTGHSKQDILNIIHMCQNFLGEIQPASQWLGLQQDFVIRISRIFTDTYFTLFGEQPPPRSMETPRKEVLLDTPEIRKQTIREVALSLTKSGNEVSDEAVLEELKRRGMKIELANPTATISTVLRGFRPQFEKVQGKRGVFRRQQ